MDDFEQTRINTENAKAEQQNMEAASLDEEPDFKYSYYANGYECMLLGVTTVIGGQLYGWNAGFASGFGSYFVGQVMVGLAYIILLSCLAEMSGTLAFPGGTYGLARAVLGFFPGFLVGCFEASSYVFMSTASVIYIGQLFVSFTNCDPSLQPALWFIFYGFTILTTCFDARIFWGTSTTLAIVCIVLLLIYCLGSLQYVNLAVNGPYFNNTATYVNTSTLAHFNMSDLSLTTRIVHSSGQNYTQVLMTPLLPGPSGDVGYWFVGGFNEWLSALQYCTWGFAGIESLTLMTSMTKDPKQAISFGCSYGVLILFFTCILTVVVCAAMPPGLFATTEIETFMSVGYMMMFPNLSYVATLALILPGQIGMGWGFVVPLGKLLSSLATSNLLPSFFMLRGAKSPRKGIIIGCIVGYIICLIGFFQPTFSEALQPIAIASSTLCYFAALFAFYKLRTTFGMLPREYTSPYGLIGAAYCGCVFVLVFISTVFFQDDPTYTCLISMIGIWGILFLYYMCFAKHEQTFSKDEQKTVFRLHVIVFNMRKMRHATRPNYASPMAKVINYAMATTVGKRSKELYHAVKKKLGLEEDVVVIVRRVKKIKKSVDDRIKVAVEAGRERVRSGSKSLLDSTGAIIDSTGATLIRKIRSNQTLSQMVGGGTEHQSKNDDNATNISTRSRSNDNMNVSTRSADNLLVSSKSEYEDEYIVPMNVVDMTHGVQYNIGQTNHVKKPSFLSSVVVVVNNPGDMVGGVGGGGSNPTTARDPPSFRSMVSNAVTRQVRRSFGSGPAGVGAGIDRNMVVPTNEMVTTAQKMEMLNAKQQQQQQQQQQSQLQPPPQQRHQPQQPQQQQNRPDGIMRVASLENMDYEAMDISQASSSTKSESTQMVGAGGGPSIYRF